MIDFTKIATSISYFSDNHGFKRIETPWTVTKAVSDLTRPPDAGEWTIKEKNKVLVASAEQGFLYLMVKGFLPKGKYQSVSPCFRDEPFDQSHTKYFLKNELIDTENVTEKNLDNIIGMCYQFFSLFSPNSQVVNTESGFDIEINGVEVGSYGIRRAAGMEWIYATACAEPRLSFALSLS